MKLLTALVLLSVVAWATADEFKYIQNNQIRVGVDTSKGGTIGYLSAVENGGNVINDHDQGRLVQLSFYSGPSGYDGCSWSGHPWSWNPIGGGDAYGHNTQILELDAEGDSLSVASRPLQWACDNVPCDCTFEKNITLDENAVWVTATLKNNRADHTDYGKYPQELPAAYTNGFMDRLTCYTGSKPWTNDALTNWDNATGPPWYPGHITCTENWAAFVDPTTNFGMAVFRPDWPIFYCGFAGKHGTGGSKDSNTGYIAGDGCGAGINLTWNATFTYKFALVLGDLPTIRAYIYKFKDQVTQDCNGYATTTPEQATPIPPPLHPSFR